MLNRYFISAMLALFSLFNNTILMANSANDNVVGGVGLADMRNTSYLDLGELTNQFSTNGKTSTSGVVGLGIGYQWDNWLKQYPVSFDLGGTVYYIHHSISGVETPAVDIFSGADTLNYKADEDSLAWMLEGKLIHKAYAFEPYIIGGIGVSSNNLDNYRETPSNPALSAVATSNFANKTTTVFAWEIGVGVQHNLCTSASWGALILAAEYRYMDWGLMSLGTTVDQTTFQGPHFGNLTTNLFDARLSWQY